VSYQSISCAATDCQPNIAKLQILTLATKLLVLSPTTPLLLQLSQYLFTLARYDQDYDIRDRARFLGALQRGIKDEKASSIENEEDEDVGGVVLRREQVKVVLLAQRHSGEDKSAISTGDYDVGSMSRMMGRKLNGYTGIPDWTDDPTDPSLRESELDDPARQAVPVAAISSAAPVSATPRPVHLSSAARPPGASPAGSSPAGSLPLQGRAKFQDLDAFLNSDSEESSEESQRSVSSEIYDETADGPATTKIPLYPR
jgi:AP-3 complex subunit beta